MAIIKSGPLSGLSGSSGGLTYSPQSDGSTVVKTKNKPSDLPLTQDQLAELMNTELFANLMKPLMDFMLVGYTFELQTRSINPYNTVVIFIRKKIVKSVYHECKMDFSEILKIKAPLTLITSLSKIVESGINFKWETEQMEDDIHDNEQAMIGLFSW